MRENAFQKARRYVIEGRLTVVEVSSDRISALCRGDGEVYALGYRHDWNCSCPAVSRNCSHLIALRLVTIVNQRSIGTDVRIGDGDASVFDGTGR